MIAAGTDPGDEFLSVLQVARRIGRSKELVRQLITAGRLPAHDLRGPESSRACYRVRRADLEAYIDACRVAPPG